VKINSAFPSKYLKESDLGGREVPCVIDRVTIEDVGGPSDPEEKPVMYFVNKAKGMVLNKTNSMYIASKYGDETDDWKGKAIIIHPDSTMFQGKMVPCLRVRFPVLAATDDSNLPF
jgi:hypothetical protein